MGANGSKTIQSKISQKKIPTKKKSSSKVIKESNSKLDSKKSLYDVSTFSKAERFSPEVDKKRKNKKTENLGVIKISKSIIDAASEIDILRIIKRNNHKNEDFDLIDKCLLQHFIFRTLQSGARNEIIKEMSLCKVDADTFIFRQHSIGNFFYLIKEGEVQVFVNGNSVKKLGKGESFGELALLHGAPRSAGVKTIGITYIWCLERRNFRKIVDHINYLNFEENKKFIESVEILSNIESEFKSILTNNMIKEHYEKDNYIVKGNLIQFNFILLKLNCKEIK
jgi:hypothetical protein